MATEIVCAVSNLGSVSVKFTGGYLAKRELVRLLKAVKAEHKKQIVLHRKEVKRQDKGKVYVDV